MKHDYSDLALDKDGIPILTDLVPEEEMESASQDRPPAPPPPPPPIRSPEDIARELLNSEMVQQQLEHTYETFPALERFHKARANTLSGGQMRMLSIAKEVMTSPKLVLVDEPSAGLAPKIAAEAYEFLIHTQRALDAAVLLVDHNMETAISLADYVHIMNMGRIREHGPKSEFDVDRVRTIIQECLLGE